uniref:Homing endonuclease LAGLIDADG domain-containing protein n=1 Tax=Beauveria lii TaxID=1290591 RepID=A0A7S6TBM0_9HYPO|nr:hypothetical protein J2C28_mgp10 [Beauveria lii]QOU11087.1 hypothetical protein [Beauveria lii]
MRTPKIEALHRLIDWLNSRNQTQLIKLELNSTSLGNNSWLAGFIEADGSFHCGFDLNDQGLANKVRCYMTISQKQVYNVDRLDLLKKNNSNLDFMKQIQEFLEVKTVNEIKRIKKLYVEEAYIVRTNKKASCDILINYLKTYPLFSSKHQDFLDWSKAYHIKITKKYINKEGTYELLSIKNSMNTKRTQFNWDSLNNFYV